MPPKINQLSKDTFPNGTIQTSILDRIRPIEINNYNRLKFCSYGDPGTGKTRFSCTFPKPLLLVAYEVGTDSVLGTPAVDVAPAELSNDLWSLIDHVVSGKSSWSMTDKGWKHHHDKDGRPLFIGDKYKSFVLDTASKLRKIRIDEIFASKGQETPKTLPPQYAGKEWKDVWNQCSKDMHKLLGAILSIPNTNDINIVINCHEANLTYDDGSSPSTSEILKPNMSTALGKAVADFLNAEVSYLGQMLIRDKFEVKQVQKGELIEETRVKLGSEYVMRVGPDAIYRTKFRRPLTVTKPLPDFIVDPSYEKIVKVIKGEI